MVKCVHLYAISIINFYTLFFCLRNILWFALVSLNVFQITGYVCDCSDISEIWSYSQIVLLWGSWLVNFNLCFWNYSLKNKVNENKEQKLQYFIKMKKLGFKQWENLFQGFMEPKVIKANSAWIRNENPTWSGVFLAHC